MQAFAKKEFFALFLSFSLSSVTVFAQADVAPNFSQETLIGDWGGQRSAWYNQGIDWGFGIKADAWRSTGGLKSSSQSMWLGDVKLKLDANKLWQMPGTTLYFNVQTAHGGKLNRDTGSYMGVDNLEVSASATKLFHAWLEKNSENEQFSLLAGLYPMDSEFYGTEASGLFLNPSFGISSEISGTAVGQVGNSSNGANGRSPSIFNTSSLGVRFKYQPTRSMYAQIAVNDGVPGDPNNAKGTHVRLDRGDGTFVISELGLKPSLLGLARGAEAPASISKVAVGAWRYNPKFNDWENGSRKRNFGAYVLAEQSLTSKLAAFFRHGSARDEVSLFKSSTSLGLTLKGLVPGRENDQLGFAATRARASNSLRRAETGLEAYEQVVELTYRAQATPWLAIQPNLQYITNPGLNPELKNAKVLGVRFELTL